MPLSKQTAMRKRRAPARNAAAPVQADRTLRPASTASMPPSRNNRADEENDDAFIHRTHDNEPVAELLGERFVAEVTSGEHAALDDEVLPEEVGGPFVETDEDEEFAYDLDSANPEDATREPFPNTHGPRPR